MLVAKALGPPEEAVLIVAQRLQEKGFLLEARLAKTSMDVYCRGEEWELLHEEDLIDDGQLSGFVLGRAERGQRRKMGPNQGILVDAPDLITE